MKPSAWPTMQFAVPEVWGRDPSQENPMSVITTVMPIVKNALNVIEAFTGTAEEASKSSTFSDAVEVFAAIVPVFDSFSRGVEVTEADVRAAFVDMDDANDALDAEIEKQQAG